jgi:hypothetical protein
MSTSPSGPEHLLHRAATGGRVPDRTRPITAEKVVKVALNPDDELRNLQVALLYSLTSRRLNAQLFPAATSSREPSTNANWFTVGQWAVLTVGKNFRSRDMPHRASVLPDGIRRRITPAVLNLRAAEDRRVAAALSFGQVMVLVSTYNALLDTPFADGPVLGPDPFIEPELSAPAPVDADGPSVDPSGPAPVMGDVADDEVDVTMTKTTLDNLDKVTKDAASKLDEAAAVAAEEDRLERQTAKVLAARLGAETEDLPITGRRSEFYRELLRRLADIPKHQRELRQAFDLYERARPDGQAQALVEQREERSSTDLVFEATLRIIAIEQVIIDEAVTMVVNHVPQYAASRLEGRIATFAERSLHVPRRIAQVSTSRRLADATAVAREMWARVMTDQVMVLAFPSETLRLGRDLPPRDWREPFYCKTLTHLSPEAQEVFDSFDRSLGDGRGAGAGDWRRFDDRMNFAANMLRSRFSEPSLHWQPFTDEDIAKIWDGHYPSRIGDPYEQAVRTPYYPGELGSDPMGIAHNCSGPIR